MLLRQCPSNFGGASDLLSPQTNRIWFEVFSAVNLAAMGFLSFAAQGFLREFIVKNHIQPSYCQPW
jgi:hypothetical protein